MSYQDYKRFWDYYVEERDYLREVYPESDHGVAGLGTVTIVEARTESQLFQDRPIDILVFNGCSQVPCELIPRGIKMLVLVDCDPGAWSELPKSLICVDVILSAVEAYSTLRLDVSDLPRLQAVWIWDCSEAVRIECLLPEGLDLVSIYGALALTIVPPARRGPKQVKLDRVSRMSPWQMDAHLESLEVDGYEGKELEITLACSERLQTLKLSKPVLVADREVSTLEEYQAVCLRMRRKKAAMR